MRPAIRSADRGAGYVAGSGTAGHHRRTGRAVGGGSAGIAGVRRTVTGIPVVTSPNGKGAINERHALAFGSIGRNGTYAANDATKNADVILALGFTFDDRATSAWLDGYTLSIPPSRLIQIDIDPAELGRNYPAELPILGCARASLRS